MTYPTIMPALTLDFLNSQQLDPRITFSRSGTATYVDGGVIKTSPANVARFEEKGLLVEESKTNFRTYSAITTAELTAYQNKATIVSSTETAPDGTVSGVQISNNTGADDSYCWTNFTNYCSVPTTGLICASIFVKMVSGTEIEIKGGIDNQGWIAWAGVKVDFTTATPTITLLGASGQNALGGDAIPYGNGWWRIWYYIDTADGFNSGNTKAVGVVPRKNGTSAYIWGAQIEAGSYPTSYIPTSSSTVTRSTDVAEMTADNFSNWYNSSEGTFFVDTKAPSLTNTVVASLSTNGNNRMEIRSSGSSLTDSRFVVVESAATQFNSNITNNNTYRNLALGYKLNNANAAANGTLGTLDTTFSVPAVDNLYLGNNMFATTQRPGHISRISYYNERLADSQLTLLTS